MSIDNFGPFVTIDYIPAFGFAPLAVFVEVGISVVRVNLDGQIGGSVEDFGQKREGARLAIAEKFAMLRPEFPKRNPGIRAVFHYALPVGMSGDCPAFAGLIGGDIITEFVFQPGSAPDSLFKNGF
jgi:hypothetical protein